MAQRQQLRTGYTTGACAAAAAKGACMCLFDQEADSIELVLPGGQTAAFVPEIMLRANITAQCGVRKDAGDDPDATHNALIKARVVLLDQPAVIIKGGPGVGRVTRPGLAVPPGQPAINPVPRQMITDAVKSILPEGRGAEVVISVIDGENIARKTLNHRLGIIGGISILGTTGIVVPYSHEAYRDSIKCSLDVAQALCLDTVVLSTGKTSEKTAQKIFRDMPEASFILMGDYVSFAVKEAVQHGMRRVVIACYPGKLLKMAAGAESTHVSSSAIDLPALADAASLAGADASLVKAIENANTVRHAFSFFDPALKRAVCRRLAKSAIAAAMKMVNAYFTCDMIVLSFENEILFKSFLTNPAKGYQGI
jgi:cobalt-precorrin-5B (C1)-methyltransferase